MNPRQQRIVRSEWRHELEKGRVEQRAGAREGQEELFSLEILVVLTVLGKDRGLVADGVRVPLGEEAVALPQEQRGETARHEEPEEGVAVWEQEARADLHSRNRLW